MTEREKMALEALNKAVDRYANSTTCDIVAGDIIHEVKKAKRLLEAQKSEGQVGWFRDGSFMPNNAENRELGTAGWSPVYAHPLEQSPAGDGVERINTIERSMMLATDPFTLLDGVHELAKIGRLASRPSHPHTDVAEAVKAYEDAIDIIEQSINGIAAVAIIRETISTLKESHS